MRVNSFSLITDYCRHNKKLLNQSGELKRKFIDLNLFNLNFVTHCYNTNTFYLATERIILLTEDGSHTVNIPCLNVTYHSMHGAVQESRHVFLKTGLQYFIAQNKKAETINVFEIGFGTGLNALLSLQAAIQLNQKIIYQTIEAEPLLMNEVDKLNYTSFINKNLQESFLALHKYEWNEVIIVHNLFSFQKIKSGLEQFEANQKFHVIYFDAFDPNVQPDMWTETVFRKMFGMLYENGILVTYCSKGNVRRAMQTAGFTVQKLKGPPGKREIVRAVKTKPR